MGSVVDDAEETNQTAVPHQNEEEERAKFEKKYTVVYVLGGPGAGKSTQCSNISKQIGFKHNIGDLLREASKCDAENGSMIERMKKEGESVPTDLTMAILMKVMDQSRNNKFLLDGFPRDEEMRAAFEEAVSY